jgi:diguanylate cyclase (GGDEF)-like protein/PAS domain S-box-containing protein
MRTVVALMPAPLEESSPAAVRDRALRVSEARYRRLFETAQDGILLLNAETAQIEDVNPFLIKMLGYDHAEFLGKKLWEVGPFVDIAQSKHMFAELQATGYVRYDNLPLKTKAGTSIDVEFVSNSYDCEDVKVIQCNIRDISDRTVAEAQARQRTRLYAALSQCNHAIVHCTTQEELFPEICRIAVELGGAKMAWVGLADAATGSVRPVASWGDASGYLKDIKISAREDSPFGCGPVGRAIRENRPVWLQDLMHEPVMAPWRGRMATCGWSASAALPLVEAGDVIGIFNVYSDEAAYFDESARDLLCELAMDISFALNGFASEALRQRVEEALRTSENQFHTLAEAIPQLVWITRPDGGNVYFNRRCMEYTGLTLEETVDGGWNKSFHPDDRQRALEAWKNATAARGVYSLECRLRRADGAYRWWLVQGMPLQDRAGNIIKWFGTCTDIHDLKTAEINIRRLNRVHALLSGINTLIVRATDRDELINEVCRLAVEKGGFYASVMCLDDRSGTKIRLVASAGKDEGLLELIRTTISSVDKAQQTLTAQAFREKAAVVVNDYEHDPRALHALQCAQFGVLSVVALPVIVADAAMGVLTLYAKEVNFFNKEELTLLAELVHNIGFAINYIGNEQRLKYLAYYDELTGLANRSLLLERVGQYLRGEAGGRHKIAILLIDLDRFKHINDSLGRPAGDALLKQVGEWLAQNRGDANLVARLGADHFGVVLPNVAPGRGLERLVEDMLKALIEHPFCVQDAVLRVSATVGIALFPNDGADAEALFTNAEAALKKAKDRGSRYLFYTAAMTNTVQGELSLETQLREAFEKEQFVLYYQPKISLANNKFTDAEALIRWNDPRTGLVLPGRFIRSLEETGLIYEVGRWVLGRALKDYVRWRAAGLPIGRIAVNVSPVQLRDPDFIAELSRIVSIDAHAAAGLELEITEGTIMEDITTSIASLRAIRAMGITIAIDDFGTGFSSLSYLAKLPIDTLKIDRSFVVEMTTGHEGLTLVSTIISLAHGLNLKVVAEGVESDEQFRLLRLLACDEMQGYLFSKPIPADVFASTYLDRRWQSTPGPISAGG